MQKESNVWRDHATDELRNHLVYKIVQSVIPNTDPKPTLHDPRMQYVLTFAKNVEKTVFELATSRSEYYHLLAGKIYKIQQELENRRQKRKQHEQLYLHHTESTISQSSVAVSDPNTPPLEADIELISSDSHIESALDQLHGQQPFSEEMSGLSATSSPSSSEAFISPLLVSRDPLNPPAQLPAVSMTGSPITQPEQCRMVQQQLAFLIHASNCHQTDIGKNCPQHYCFQMKIILHHILNCKEEGNCSFVNCAFYKDINKHWTICKSSDCPLCLPVALEEMLSIND